MNQVEIMQDCPVISIAHIQQGNMLTLTCYTRKQLTSEILNLAVGKRDKAVALQKVKDALAKEAHDDADMTLVVKAVRQVYTSIPIFDIVSFESGQHS